jgi:hypothetical protein
VHDNRPSERLVDHADLSVARRHGDARRDEGQRIDPIVVASRGAQKERAA